MSSSREISNAIVGAVVAVDFDGTLAAIAPHPADSRPAEGAANVLLSLAEAGATIAIVTGRMASAALQISGFGHIPGLVIEGQYGAERWHNDRLDTLPPPPGLDLLRNQLPALVHELTGDSDVWIEDKEISLVVHARLTRDPAAVLAALHGPLQDLASSAELEVHSGKGILEIRLPGVDKAHSIERLVSANPTAVVFAGDDVGDIPAFNAVHEWRKRTLRPAMTIGVVPHRDAPVSGIADIEVDDPSAVIDILAQLVP